MIPCPISWMSSRDERGEYCVLLDWYPQSNMMMLASLHNGIVKRQTPLNPKPVAKSDLYWRNIHDDCSGTRC